MKLLIGRTYREVLHKQISELILSTIFSASIGLRLMKEHLEHFLMQGKVLFAFFKPSECFVGTFSLVERDKTEAAALSVLESLDLA
jgi:hypothetical protein